MKLDKIFTSHMVFPANKSLRVYGEGKGKIKVKFNNITKECNSNDDKWCIELPPMTYGGPYAMEIDLDTERIILDDVYIGEVYIFAGQSNMAFTLEASNTSKDLYEDNNMLRIFSLPKHSTSSVGYDDGWTYSTKENVAGLSAIGYLASREIQKTKNIAVGVIVCAQGASTIESWVPEDAFAGVSEEGKFIDHRVADYYWNKDGYLYNNVFRLVTPFSVTAVTWYQGESDASAEESKIYADELTALIDIWRKGLSDENLPFVIIQIADYFDEGRDLSAWRLIQQAQLDVRNMRKNVKTVISRDVCENDDIHPKTKIHVAHRVAEVLLKGEFNVYKK